MFVINQVSPFDGAFTSRLSFCVVVLFSVNKLCKPILGIDIVLLFHYIAIVVEDRNLLVVLAFITGVCVGVLVRRRPRETPPRDGPIRY